MAQPTSACQSFYAHTDPRHPGKLPGEPGVHWQPLREHLLNVARLAERLALEARPEDLAFTKSAYWAGLLHDLGKYQAEFQQRLIDFAKGQKAKKAPHAAHGACWAVDKKAKDIALTILGHHAGLHAYRDLDTKIKDLNLDPLLKIAGRPNELGSYLNNNPEQCSVRYDRNWELRARMLFSVLVDADRLDCLEYDSQRLNRNGRLFSKGLDAPALFTKLKTYITERARSVPDGVVKTRRLEILEACEVAAALPERLLSLAVPTGGGKTLASIAFALKRAIERPGEVRRVTVVVPFLSIIEQNADVLKRALGDDVVLEHHSGDTGPLIKIQANSKGWTENHGDQSFIEKEEAESAEHTDEDRHRRLMTENWDAPVIITTSVRFFESLFSNRPGDLRRIHNIARSVVILDEVQSLPPTLLGPLLSIMDGLSQEWMTTFLFCTATQPAFERHRTASEYDMRWEPGKIRPIIDKTRQAELFHALKRVADPVWPKRDQPTPWNELAKQIVSARRALCIVNVKDHAKQLCQAVRKRAEEEKLPSDCVFHLSTRMCAQHRLDRIKQIRDTLKNPIQPPCLVISTQLVEAGVDLDFPVVFRAMGPLDAIIQAAGRCDREGILTAEKGEPAGKLIVFEPEEDRSPYKDATSITRNLISISQDSLSIHNPKWIHGYFNTLYASRDQDHRNIEGYRDHLDYPQVAKEFSLIDDRTQAVFVPYGEAGRALIEQLKRDGWMNKDQWRRAQRFQVGLYPHELEKACGVVFEVKEQTELFYCEEKNYDIANDFGLFLGSMGLYI